MYYLIDEKLCVCDREAVSERKYPYVATVSAEEWVRDRDLFDMGIDMDMDVVNIYDTKAIVNVDSLTGTLAVPDRAALSGEPHRLVFALDEKGVVFLSPDGYADSLIERIRQSRRWRLPSLERFLYDFLEETIRDDLGLLKRYEAEMARIEESILAGDVESYPPRLNDIRGDLLDLRSHYEELIDLGQELEENENGFFQHENLRYFRLFTERVSRLQDMVSSQREYIIQLRDLIQSQLSVKQNHIMTLLTVITSIFMPLTLIAGWYGMNFRYMPELNSPWGYPAVIAVSVAIVVLCLIWFHRKKWL